MNQVLSVAEINAQFDSEWVLVEDPQTNENLEVEAGTVTAHSKDRDEVYRAAASTQSKRIAILYTGEMPQGVEIVV